MIQHHGPLECVWVAGDLRFGIVHGWRNYATYSDNSSDDIALNGYMPYK
jgi:hypothetical protein